MNAFVPDPRPVPEPRLITWEGSSDYTWYVTADRGNDGRIEVHTDPRPTPDDAREFAAALCAAADFLDPK